MGGGPGRVRAPGDRSGLDGRCLWVRDVWPSHIKGDAPDRLWVASGVHRTRSDPESRGRRHPPRAPGPRGRSLLRRPRRAHGRVRAPGRRATTPVAPRRLGARGVGVVGGRRWVDVRAGCRRRGIVRALMAAPRGCGASDPSIGPIRRPGSALGRVGCPWDARSDPESRGRRHPPRAPGPRGRSLLRRAQRACARSRAPGPRATDASGAPPRSGVHARPRGCGAPRAPGRAPRPGSRR